MIKGVFECSRILRVSVSPSMPGNIRSTSRMSNRCPARACSACPPSWARTVSTPFWPRNSASSAASLRSSSMSSAFTISKSLLLRRPAETTGPVMAVKLLEVLDQLRALIGSERGVHGGHLRDDDVADVARLLDLVVDERVQLRRVELVGRQQSEDLRVHRLPRLRLRLERLEDVLLGLLDGRPLLRRRVDVILGVLDARRDHVLHHPSVRAAVAHRGVGSAGGQHEAGDADSYPELLVQVQGHL